MNDSEETTAYAILWNHLQIEADEYLGADDDPTFELRDDGVYLLVNDEPKCHWDTDTFEDLWRRGRGTETTRRITKYTLVTSVLFSLVLALLFSLNIISETVLIGVGILLVFVFFIGIKSWRAHTPRISPSNVYTDQDHTSPTTDPEGNSHQ